MRNQYRIDGDVVYVQITARGSSCEMLVDVQDLALADSFPWKWTAPSGYATMVVAGVEGRRRVSLHRVIMQPPEGYAVDHINHDTLDNRRENLRLVTPAQNLQNVIVPRGDSKHGLKNLYFDPLRQLWAVRITVDGHTHYLGFWEDPAEALAVAHVARATLMPYSYEALHIEPDESLVRHWEESYRMWPRTTSRTMTPKGVCYIKKGDRHYWLATRHIGPKHYDAGLFTDLEEAAEAAKRLFLETDEPQELERIVREIQAARKKPVGVSWNSKRQNWVAVIGPYGRVVEIGRFATEAEARRARSIADAHTRKGLPYKDAARRTKEQLLKEGYHVRIQFPQ